MKTTLLILLALAGSLLLRAEPAASGPNQGRLLDAAPLKAEFFVNADRKVALTFLDAALKPVAAGSQVVAVIAEPAAGPVTLELERTATGFASKSPLPAGDPYRVVVQLRATPEAKPQNFRIDFQLAPCGECKRAEYACICEGH